MINNIITVIIKSYTSTKTSTYLPTSIHPSWKACIVFNAMVQFNSINFNHGSGSD